MKGMLTHLSRLAVLTLLTSGGCFAQWTQVGTLPFMPPPPTLATGTYTPRNATPFARSWTKPIYDSNNAGLLLNFANPNCCGGTFSNAEFLYKVDTNSWLLMWSHLTVAAGPGPADTIDAPSDMHTYHGVVWDSTRNVMWKAFGTGSTGGTTGNCGDCAVNDTYMFDTNTGVGIWTQVCGNVTTPCAPPQYQETAMAYDPTHDVVLLYGGLKGGTASSDTWEFSPATLTWTKICGNLNKPFGPVCGSPALDGPGLVYDAALGKFVLFGGTMSGNVGNSQTWTFDVGSGVWTRVNTTANPTGTKFQLMDYVPTLAAVVSVDVTNGSVWKFDGSDWTNLGISGAPTFSTVKAGNFMAWDNSAAELVIFIVNGRTYIWSLRF